MNRESDDPNREHPGELLSLWVDGDLEGERERRVEAHLEECEGCRETAADLQSIAERAGRLPDRAPEGDLWPGIARQIGSSSATEAPAAAPDGTGGVPADGEDGVIPLFRRRWRVSVPQAAAAAALVATLAAGLTWSLARDGAGPEGTSLGPVASARPGSPAGAGTAAGGPASGDLPVRWATTETTPSGVAELEERYRQARSELDPATRRTLDRNLRLIDRALAEAQRALADSPDNDYLHYHLSRTMRRKAEFLEVAVRMTQAD